MLVRFPSSPALEPFDEVSYRLHLASIDASRRFWSRLEPSL